MSGFTTIYEHIVGFRLNYESTLVGSQESARCILEGKSSNGLPSKLAINDDLFSKHLLVLGNVGTGKTNTISQIVRQVKDQLTEEDVVIIFDSKGDFYDEFYKEGDVVFTNNFEDFKGALDRWNIFSEVCIDRTARSIKENAFEIASTLFYDKIKKTSQPFFPSAAKDIFATILTIFAMNDHQEDMNNEALINYLLEDCSIEGLRALFTQWNQHSVNSYILSDDSPQTAGVISELYQLLREVFVGDFRSKGTLSIRDLIRKKGGKTIFIEYDMSIGTVLTPVYRLLLDLAIKEALGRNKSKGNVWFFIDEFRLVPHLKHLDDGINFGRSQGAKFIIAAQNIPQIYKEYGMAAAQSLLSGLSTTISFRVDDQKSRAFIQDRYGNAIKKLIYQKTQGDICEEIKNGRVIEDWDISGLSVGSAIIGIPGQDPTTFHFENYVCNRT